MNAVKPESMVGARAKRFWLPVVFVAGFLVLFWVQVLNVPFWQDDYFYLLQARTARIEGKPWTSPFVPELKVSFWRPLGMETYWRFLETYLAGDARAAHFTNILLLAASAGAVGWLVATLIGVLQPGRARAPGGLLAALLYGVHASHFLPAAWVAAANDSIAVFWSALTLRFWLVVSSSGGRSRMYSLLLLFSCLVLALLSRDIAFVLPALALLLTLWLWPRSRPAPIGWVAGALCFGLSLIWLAARQRFTLPADPAYELELGVNVVRNALLLILFFFNAPFEALRYFFFVSASPAMALWGIISFMSQLAAFLILLRGAQEHLGRRDYWMLLMFFLLGCAPYFLLSRNCYPYYTSIGLFAYAFIAGMSNLRPRSLLVVVLLAVLSSFSATLGNYFLDPPSHIGRAKWAERQMVKLAALHVERPDLFSPLYVAVQDNHLFLGFGVDGLAYRLGMDRKDIIVSGPGSPAAGRPVLVVPGSGDVYFTDQSQ